MTETSDAPNLPSLKPLLFLSLALAVWIDFGSLHEMDNADGLVPILASLYKWTPFYWDQDRYGMLVPLLALPVKQPFWNLQLQWLLNVFAGVFSFVLGARYLFPAREWPLVAMLGMGLYFALTPLQFRYHYLGPEQPYALGMTLGFAALLVAPRSLFLSVRLVISCLLMALAHWVNIGLVLILAPVVLAQAASNQLARNLNTIEKERQLWRHRLHQTVVAEYGVGFVVTMIGALGGLLSKQLLATQRTTTRFSSAHLWGRGWHNLLKSTAGELSPQFWPLSLAIIASMSLILICLPVVRRRFSVFVLRPALLVGSSVMYFLLIGTLEWVKDNFYSARYLHPGLVIFQAAVVALLVVPLGSYLSARMLRRLSITGSGIVIAATYIGFGMPSVSRVREQVAQIDLVTSDVLAARCTHVAGNYWDVWPTVYRATLALFERGEQRPIYGITERAGPTLNAAKAVPREQMRIALLPTPDGEGERWLHSYEFPPLAVLDRRTTIAVLEPVDSTVR